MSGSPPIYIFSSFAREGMIEPAQLIKIAQKCNYELGLRINSTKETILDVEHGRCKLPTDFDALNVALLCRHGRHIESGLFNGLHTEDRVIPNPNPLLIPQLTSCPCWQVVCTTACSVVITNPNGSKSTINFTPNNDGSPSTTNVCALSIPETTGITFTTSSFCVNDPNTGQVVCPTPGGCGCTDDSWENSCGAINTDPWKQNRVYTICDNKQQVNVIEYRSDIVRQYSQFEKIRLTSSKEATSFCVNTQFKDAFHQGHIRDGFLFIPTLNHHRDGYSNDYKEYHHARVYICYLGAMEDDQGNLLVLDHPYINEYYEYSLKKRILENIYIGGEPDIERRMALIDKEYKNARAIALSIVTTPDFHELKQVIERNRAAMHHKYIHPFSKLFANSPGFIWAINNEVI